MLSFILALMMIRYWFYSTVTTIRKVYKAKSILNTYIGGVFDMKQVEINIIESFRRVKNDIIRIERQIVELSKRQEQVMKVVVDTKDKESMLSQKVKDLKSKPRAVMSTPKTKVITKTRVITKTSKAKKTFVASKEGKKFHMPECPFAKNIKPKSKLTFKSKNTALNQGFKPCECAKK